jgi:hypothetical protein
MRRHLFLGVVLFRELSLSTPIVESGLEALTSSLHECAARHLGATERLTSRTAALSS